MIRFTPAIQVRSLVNVVFAAFMVHAVGGCPASTSSASCERDSVVVEGGDCVEMASGDSVVVEGGDGGRTVVRASEGTRTLTFTTRATSSGDSVTLAAGDSVVVEGGDGRSTVLRASQGTRRIKFLRVE